MSVQFMRKFLTLLWITGFACSAHAGEPKLEYRALSPQLVAVPQYLLNFVHTPEVQQDLRLSAKQLMSFEATLRTIDKALWPARIRPLSEQRKLVAELEDKFLSEVERLYGAGKVERLRQIELQSQGSRILVRPEVEAFLRLDTKQRKKLSDLFSENDRLAALASTRPSVDSDSVQAFQDAKTAEPEQARAVLTSAQAEQIRKALGPPIDTSKFKRIYPFAPELIDSEYWSTNERVKLEALRGQVVLVQFYAFQCHNCVANFAHYKRWDETLKKRGVKLIGIQTPETSAERDPVKVTSAAQKEGFQFPVLIDVESRNWDAWGNTMWPTVYVIDKKGYIRFWYQGELNWQGATADRNIENLIDDLVKE